MNKKILCFGLIAATALAAHTASAGVGVGVRAGTFGFGGEFDIGLTESLNLRLGYNTFSYDETVDDTDVVYDGTLKISSPSAIFDWHVFGGGFRLSLGAVSKGPKIDVDGTPAPGTTVYINDEPYSSSEVGSLTGTVKIGDSTAPYIGIGWGNTVDKEDRVTFLFDIGAIRTGSPKATLNVICGSGIATPSECDALKQNVNAEKAELENEMDGYEWWPVVALGFAVRF